MPKKKVRKGPAIGSGPVQAYFWDHVNEPSDGCRDWPYAHAANGYGVVRYRNSLTTVHQLTCIVWNGPKPKGKDAAHSCGNRGCWAGEHLRWATPPENASDKVGHGTYAATKLTATDVRQIRFRYHSSGETATALAIEYGVSITMISRIVRRLAWKHVK